MPRPPLPTFRRATTADQVAASLREGIQRGDWGKLLPSERALALHYGVSRPSIHAAVLELGRAGLLEKAGRRTARILSRRPPATGAPMACIATPFSRESHGDALAEDPLRLALRAQLATVGIGWNETIDARLGKERPDSYLARLVAGHGRACWLIDNSSSAIQEWFEKAGVPTLVLGTCYPGVSLPSVDTDYYAIGRHAAGQMIRHGHRHLAVIVGPHRKPGDLECRDGIIDQVRETGREMSAVEIKGTLDMPRLRAEVDRMLKRQPRPTAVFTMLAEIAQCVFIHLLRSGIRVPSQMSFISRDSHTLFDTGSPEITRYNSSNIKKAKVTTRMIESLLAGRPVTRKPVFLTPTFIPGETLARAPGQSEGVRLE